MCKLDFSLVYVMGRVSLSRLWHHLWVVSSSAPDICTCLIYDILIFSRSHKEHSPLVYILAERHAKTDPATIRAVKEWPVLVASSTFPWFHQVLPQIHPLQSGSQAPHTPHLHQSAFLPFYTKLKHLFTTALVLIHPDTSNRLSLR